MQPEFNKEQFNKKKKKKRKFRPSKFLFSFVLLIVLVVSLALSPLFNIKVINVRGSSHYSQEEILSATDLALGNNAFKMLGSNISGILRFRYFSDEKRITDKFIYIKNAAVKYIIPGKVIINLTEREPKFIAIKDSEGFLMDGEGILLEKLKDLKNPTMPIIKGLNFKVFEIGQALEKNDLDNIKLVLKLKNALYDSDKDDTFKLSERVNYYEVSKTGNISIMVDSRIFINFGNLLDVNYRIRFAKYLFSKSIGTQDRGTLDFSSGENPRYIPEH
jgi:cell division protein FtsQ